MCVCGEMSSLIIVGSICIGIAFDLDDLSSCKQIVCFCCLLFVGIVVVLKTKRASASYRIGVSEQWKKNV